MIISILKQLNIVGGGIINELTAFAEARAVAGAIPRMLDAVIF